MERFGIPKTTGSTFGKMKSEQLLAFRKAWETAHMRSTICVEHL
jgi:hypothetical protein